MVDRSKRFVALYKQIDRQKAYTPEEAVELLKKTANAKFDETIELHLHTMSDPRHADQLIRGVSVLPHGLGKQVRVLVLAPAGDAAERARQAGAEYVGDDDLIKKIEEGWLDFDLALAVPEVMNKIGRLGRILGRKGLMPNPKTGTMVRAEDLPRAIDEAKKGRVEFRMDKTAIIHAPLGKASFEPRQILENLFALTNAIVKAKPAGVKSPFIRSAFIKTTMGPSIKLDLSALLSVRAAA